jgi:hypothetical protein
VSGTRGVVGWWYLENKGKNDRVTYTYIVVYGVPSKMPLISTSANSVDDKDARSWKLENKGIKPSQLSDVHHGSYAIKIHIQRSSQ